LFSGFGVFTGSLVGENAEAGTSTTTSFSTYITAGSSTAASSIGASTSTVSMASCGSGDPLHPTNHTKDMLIAMIINPINNLFLFIVSSFLSYLRL
jgi:hypothetical protein